MSIQSGQVYDNHYRFDKVIGEGTYGVTWVGYHQLMDRKLAIKVIDVSRLSESDAERAWRECQIGSWLEHPHIVKVQDAFLFEAYLCIVMELMDGGNLADHLKTNQPAVERILQWGVDLCDALRLIHHRGIIHRDIKPGNLLLTNTGIVRIADFGIARIPGSQLTRTAQPGTMVYAAPEQVGGQPVGPKADVYGLTAVLTEALVRQDFSRFRNYDQTIFQEEFEYGLRQNYSDTPVRVTKGLSGILAAALHPNPEVRSGLHLLRIGLERSRDILLNVAITAPLSHIGRFEIQSVIGQGGGGTVYKAYDPKLQRAVAIKTIPISNEAQFSRYLQEIRAAGRLNHQNIIQIYDVDEVKDLAYIVMEFIGGPTLRHYLSSPTPWQRAVQIILPLCQALAFAHQQGVIHRDIKPENIMFTTSGQVKIGDFGVARLAEATGVTKTGVVLGTPAYMAPEQVDGDKVDERADLFALGVMLYEMITGQKPFGELGWLMQPRPFDSTPLKEAAIPPVLGEIIRKAMAVKRVDRYASALGIIDDLEKLVGQDRPFTVPGIKTVSRISDSSQTIRQLLPLIQLDRGIQLEEAERRLIAETFRGYDQVHGEYELNCGADLVRHLVVLPIRSSRRLTRVLLKLGPPARLRRELTNYREYVAGVLPLAPRLLQDELSLSPDGQLALLRFAFAGSGGDPHAQTLADFYSTDRGEAGATFLSERILQPIGLRWWQDRLPYDFSLEQVYDPRLPVHFVIEAQEAPSEAAQILDAKQLPGSIPTFEIGQSVLLRNFSLDIDNSRNDEIYLHTDPTKPIRVKIINLSRDALPASSGWVIPAVSGAVIATRETLLLAAIQKVVPEVDIKKTYLPVGGRRLKNPLAEDLVTRTISGTKSVIHGNFTLDAILFEPTTKSAWLIDFSAVRQGYRLFDLLELETQVLLRLFPPVASGGPPLLSDGGQLLLPQHLFALLETLHQTDPPTTVTEPRFQAPYRLLQIIRAHASQYLSTSRNWDEYYLGLAVILLGRLTQLAGNSTSGRVLWWWMVGVYNLIDKPLSVSAPTSTGAGEDGDDVLPANTDGAAQKLIWRRVTLFVISCGLLALLWLAGPTLRERLGQFTAPPVQQAAIIPLATITPRLTPTVPPSLTPTPIATSGPFSIRTQRELDIYAGPGYNYPVIDSLAAGVELPLTGANSFGDWLQIFYPPGPGGYGWIPVQSIQEILLEIPDLPLAIASPPPTATETPTVTPTPSPTPTPPPTATPTPSPSPAPTATVEIVPLGPAGTPTSASTQARRPAYDTNGYRELDKHLSASITSQSFAPHGGRIAVTEGIKVYVVDEAGTRLDILMEEDETIRPMGGIVWSPDGEYIAFMADFKRDCTVCRTVGLVDVTTGVLTYLQPPSGYVVDLPRWTQDGRLLVTAHQGVPSTGITYIYTVRGSANPASGSYLLGSNDEEQGWLPWYPGAEWQAGRGQGDSYYDR